MLTTQEKSLLRQLICVKGATPRLMADYATRDEAAVKAELAAFKTKRVEVLTRQKNDAEAGLAELA